MSLIILNALCRGFLHAEHDDGHASAPAPAVVTNAEGSDKEPDMDVQPTLVGTTTKLAGTRSRIASRKQATAKRDVRTRPLLHKMVNDLQQTSAAFEKETVLVDSFDFTGDGFFEIAPNVQQYVEDAGRGALVMEVVLRVAVTIAGRLYITFARLDSSDASAAYADAFDASLTEWIWVKWEDGEYNWGGTSDPEVAASAPKWPVDRTPEQLYMAMRIGRYIDDPNHHLIQRIVLGRR